MLFEFCEQKTLSTSRHYNLARPFCFPHSAYCVSILVVVDGVANLLALNGTLNGVVQMYINNFTAVLQM